MKDYEFWAIGLLLGALIAFTFLSSCSSTIFVEDCERVTPKYNIWKCHR